MKKLIFVLLSAAIIALPLSSHAIFGKKDPDKERKELQQAREYALEDLYAEKPSARQEIAESKGYAVFSSLGINVLLISTENGGGILRDNSTGEDTYMRMFSAGGGIGLGVKDFSVIFVFHTEKAMEEFRDSGWDFSGQADAAAKTGSDGDAADTAGTVMPGTTIYQLTKSGLALQATLQGTKFWNDDKLN